jgi:hypothetical protein
MFRPGESNSIVIQQELQSSLIEMEVMSIRRRIGVALSYISVNADSHCIVADSLVRATQDTERPDHHM